MPRLTQLGLADIARIAIFAALIAVLGMPGAIPAFGGAVPITAQTLGVMLAGAILGPRLGAAAVIVFELLVLLGLPLLSGGRGGAGVFLGPSAGYLLGWILGAIVIGLILGANRRRPTWWRTAVACFVGGILVIYAIGIPVQSLVTGLPVGPTALGSLAFLPGDLIKVAVATPIVVTLWRAYPAAFRRGASVPSVSQPDEVVGSASAADPAAR